MRPQITSIEVPNISTLGHELHDAYFYDCYRLAIDSGRQSALELSLKLLSRSPAWVNFLMGVRNTVVAWVGLKNLGHLNAIDPTKPAGSYRIGDRIGIFSLLALSDQEIILGDSDKHLDVKVSVCKMTDTTGPSIAVSTVVHVHNRLGRLYMFFVAPAHKVIAPAVLSRAAFHPNGN